MNTIKITTTGLARAGLMLLLSFAGLQIASGATPEEWPREIRLNNAKVLLYQPAPESLSGGEVKEMIPVTVIDLKTDKQLDGKVWIDALASADRENRVVDLLNVKVTGINFVGSLQDINSSAIKKQLTREIPKSDLSLPLDDLVSTLPFSNTSLVLSKGLNNDPPEIIFTDHPAFLVIFDGKPQFHSVNGSKMMKAVNTPYFVAENPRNRKFYFSAGGYWYMTRDVLKDSWRTVDFPPKKVRDFKKMVMENNTETPGSQNAPEANSAGWGYGDENMAVTPEVIVRTVPAELIQTDGDPLFTPIKGTSLMYVSNTDANVFLNSEDHDYYVLLSGRWYSASSLEGPWAWVSPDMLPPDFARIPVGSAKDNVLASVPGTKEAKEAAIEAQIPTLAEVNVTKATTNVIYNGNPQFAPIKGTSLFLAVNTRSTVIKDNNTYYALNNAVWYSSSSPTGPWTAAETIPAEFQKIPPESREYYAKFVKVYGNNGDLLYEGYSPGYLGWYMDYPLLVYGTGWGYQGWWGSYYYPWPWTWGFGWQFSPWSGWAMDFGIGYWDPFYWYDWGWYSPFWYTGWYGGPNYYHPPFFIDCDHYYGDRTAYIRNSHIPYYEAYSRERILRPENHFSSHEYSPGVKPVYGTLSRPEFRNPGSVHELSPERSIPISRSQVERNEYSSRENYRMPVNSGMTREYIPERSFPRNYGTFRGGGSFDGGEGHEGRERR
jgi:hypothetical protein